MAGARPDTWMPLYIGDYLADTMHLNHAQHGIYMLLIMAYWRNGGPLSDDAGQLAAIAKCSPTEWRKNLPVVGKFFYAHDGVWSHKRIDAELEGATTKTHERSKAGTEGARRRWQRDGKSDGKAMAKPMANASQTTSQNDAPSLKGASLPLRINKPIEPTTSGSEYVSAQDQIEVNGVNPKVRRFAPPKQAGVRENIKEQLRQKLMRFCNARLRDGECAKAITGLMGDDPEHDAQWWFDDLDARRKRSGWDDTREWKRRNLQAAK